MPQPQLKLYNKEQYIYDDEPFSVTDHSKVSAAEDYDGKRVIVKTSIDVIDAFNEIYVYSKFSHPNIVTCHDMYMDIESGSFKIVMEYGYPLMEFDRERWDAYLVITGIIEALAFLQNNGVIHNDIKIDNMVMAGGVPKLIDFGLIYKEGYSRIPNVYQTYLDPVTTRDGPSYTTEKERHDSMIRAAMWALGLAIVDIVNGTKGGHRSNVMPLNDGVPVLFLQIEKDPKYMVRKVLLPHNPELWAVTEKLFSSDNGYKRFSDIIETKSTEGIVYSPAPTSYTKKDFQGDRLSSDMITPYMGYIITVMTKSNLSYPTPSVNLALDYYSRIRKESRADTIVLKDGTSIVPNSVLQSLMCVFLADCVYDKYTTNIFLDDYLIIADADPEIYMKTAIYYLYNIIKDLNGDLYIDIPPKEYEQRVVQLYQEGITYDSYVDRMYSIKDARENF